MPRLLRIDFGGVHHVINRGLNRSNIFNTDQDYDAFLKYVKHSKIGELKFREMGKLVALDLFPLNYISLREDLHFIYSEGSIIYLYIN